MSAGFQIRRAAVADAADCARVVHGWMSSTPWMPTRFTEAELSDMIAEAIPVREIYVTGEPVAGYLSFHPETALIAGLYVAKRCEGLGKALVDHVKTGRDHVQLWTHEPNTRAHAFYEREGFARTGATREGEDGQPEFQMIWQREVGQ